MLLEVVVLCLGAHELVQLGDLVVFCVQIGLLVGLEEFAHALRALVLVWRDELEHRGLDVSESRFVVVVLLARDEEDTGIDRVLNVDIPLELFMLIYCRLRL